MTELFLHLLNISITASYMIIAVILLRLLLKKAPRNYTCILWGLVALRLAFPFNIESIFSLIPSSETVSATIFSDDISSRTVIDTGFESVNSVINPTAGSYIESNKIHLEQIVSIIAIIWIIVGISMLLLGLISYIRLKFVLRFSVHTEDGLYQSEVVKSPFIFGLIKPKIYLPFNLNPSDKELVVRHEKAHISRLDHFTKFFSFILLSVYWFNPLVWVYYFIQQKDIETACDQKVIKNMATEEKQLYSFALLKYSISSNFHALPPIAFGEISVKQRVKNVMCYKKPTLWIMSIFVLIIIFSVLGFMTNPIKNELPKANTILGLDDTPPNPTTADIIKKYDPKYTKLIEAIEKGTYNQSLSEFDSLLGGNTGISNISEVDKKSSEDASESLETENNVSTIPVTAQTTNNNSAKTKRIIIDESNWKDYYEIIYKTLKCTNENSKTSDITFPHSVRLKSGYKYAPDQGDKKTAIRMSYSATVNYYYCEFDKNGNVTRLNGKADGYESHIINRILNLNEFAQNFYDNGEILTFQNGKAIMAIRTDLNIDFCAGEIYIIDR